MKTCEQLLPYCWGVTEDICVLSSLTKLWNATPWTQARSADCASHCRKSHLNSSIQWDTAIAWFLQTVIYSLLEHYYKQHIQHRTPVKSVFTAIIKLLPTDRNWKQREGLFTKIKSIIIKRVSNVANPHTKSVCKVIFVKFVSIISYCHLLRLQGDVIVKPALVQPSICADRAPMERQDSASFSSRACHITFHTDIVREYAMFDTLLITYSCY